MRCFGGYNGKERKGVGGEDGRKGVADGWDRIISAELTDAEESSKKLLAEANVLRQSLPLGSSLESFSRLSWRLQRNFLTDFGSPSR